MHLTLNQTQGQGLPNNLTRFVLKQSPGNKKGLLVMTVRIGIITVTWSFKNKKKIRKTSKNFRWSKFFEVFLICFCFWNFKWLWYHAECMHMTTPVYMSLNNVSWHCCNCGMPNFASSLFESSIDISSTNSFSSLVDSITSPGTSSSPTSRSFPNKNNKRSNLKVLIINFQSVKNKKEAFCNIIKSSDSCIIIGIETWLNPTIHSSEMFLPNYEIIRKDRNDGYGRVLLAIKKDFIINNITISQENECEVAFAKLTFDKNQTLTVGAAYVSQTIVPWNSVCLDSFSQNYSIK